MSQHILCDEPPTARCAPAFRLQASAWIESGNFGPRSIAVDPPAGIRLRWTCPFIAVPPADRIGMPVSFIVERAGPLNAEGMHAFSPRVGHRSRAPTPRALWQRLDRTNRTTFRVANDDCRAVSAVAFSVPADGNPATVTLIDVDGVAQVVADLVPGDDFHFEWSGLKIVTFSADAGVREVIGLDLERIDNEVHYEFASIAEIDARAWTGLALTEAAERVTNGDDAQFLSIEPRAWDELRALGATVDRALTTGDETPDAAAALAMIAATSFEAAALMGWGFVDGGHASVPRIDRIPGPLLAAPGHEVFVYRVRARLQPLDGEAREIASSWAFARSDLAAVLGDVRCAVVPTPVSRAELTNAVRPGPSADQPEVVTAPSVRIACAGEWDLEFDAYTVEGVLTRPIAEDSVVTGQPFGAVGTFLSGLNRPPRRLRGNSLLERREHRFDVPFFDSDVGCEAEASDFWDRRAPAVSAGMVQPRIDYTGAAPPLAAAQCRPPEATRGAEVDLALDAAGGWGADPLAAFAKATIALFIRDPARTPAEADVETGPPSPTADGQWSANLRSGLAQSELDRFLGGQLAVGALTARVLSVGPVQGGLSRCTFEASTSCAGADLYRCPNGWLAAKLSEDPQSERLWVRLGDVIGIQPTGAPVRYSVTTALPALDASTTLYFASRLEFAFEGQAYQSSLTTPLPAPYMHPVPDAPKACLSVQQLAADYYGRILVRAEADHCHAFDPGYSMRLAVAPGELQTAEAFLTDRSNGIFAAHAPFEGAVLFEAFSRLGTLREDDRYTVGAFNVRTADDRESLPALSRAIKRRLE